jgi:hypothetical protein
LDAYFKEQRYPRSRIAIDGYDHFIKFDLPKLISNLNPFTMVKPDTGEKIEIFVGGETELNTSSYLLSLGRKQRERRHVA